MNTFDPATHTYTIDGRVVPSVTQVLNDLLPCYQASEWHLQRGTAVHACAAMIAQGKTFDYDRAIEGQVSACYRFFEEVKPVVLAVEEREFSSRHGFAGTYDLLSRIPQGLKACMVDWKASFSASLPYQLAGYSILVEENVGRIDRGYGVQLNEDGTYRMSEVYDLRRYKTGFLNMLGAYNIRRECKAKDEVMV